MFDESFEKLEIDEIASILNAVNKQVEGSVFDPLETNILAISLPFYSGYRFLDIADHATNPPLQRFVFHKDDTREFKIVDWTYKTIYEINSEAHINIDDDNVLEYVRFFFSYVKGRHGRFIICESADNIDWKDEPPAEVKKKLNETLQILKIKKKNKENVYEIEAFMILKDTLFKTDIYVEPNGCVTISDHEIIIENIPLLDPILGQ